MSSTRHAKRNPETNPDYYVTPVPSILEFFDALSADWKTLLPGDGISFNQDLVVLDPCAGGGPKHPMSYPVALRQHKLWECMQELITIDIREDSLAEFKTNYLTLPLNDIQPDVIITNPPFNIALDIIQKALIDVRHGGLVIMLLRLNFFGSQQRKTFFDSFMPLACYVHSKRMKFTDDGKSDSIEYMHAIWQRGTVQKFASLRVI